MRRSIIKSAMVASALLFVSITPPNVHAQKIPQFKWVWHAGIIVSVLVPENTSNDQLKALISEFKKARRSFSLTKYIPATTPGIEAEPHAQVIILVFSNPKWATQTQYKKYEQSSMRSQSGRSSSKAYLNHIRASYEWDKFDAKEYGSLGYDEGGVRSAFYKKLF